MAFGCHSLNLDRSIQLNRSGSDTIRVEFDEEIVAMRMGPEIGAAKTCSWLNEWI